MIVRVSY